MAFENLSDKLNNVFKNLRGKGRLSEQDVKDAMREVRLALLEADVSYKVVKDFIKTVSARATGAEVLEALSPAQMVIKIVNEELCALMGGENQKLIISSKSPSVVMLVGLQGAGKTTNGAKLAALMRKSQNKRPLLVACDVYRPAAIDQLVTVGGKLDLPVFQEGQGDPVEIARHGLLIENTDEITHLMDEISRICEIRILDYEVTDRLLDGTVFYITFANEMRDILSLDQAQTNNVLVWANRIMQRLDEDGKPVIQTFDYIRRFAQFVRSRRGDGFNAQLSAFSPAPGLMIYSIEPPCGSNTHILRYRNELLFVDSGFACYREEMLTLFRAHIPGFDSMRKRAVITHADVDHVGLLDLFETVYMAQSCYVNFELEHRGEPNYREQN